MLSRTASSKCKGYLNLPSKELAEENSNLHAWEVVESELEFWWCEYFLWKFFVIKIILILPWNKIDIIWAIATPQYSKKRVINCSECFFGLKNEIYHIYMDS